MKKPSLTTYSIKSSLAVAVCCLTFFVAPGRLVAQPSSDPLSSFWRADGFVNAIVITNNLAYVGGDFTYVGPASGAAGLLDGSTGFPISGFPKIDGSIYAAI